MDCSPSESSVHDFSGKNTDWSGLPFSSPGDLPDLEIGQEGGGEFFLGGEFFT